MKAKDFMLQAYKLDQLIKNKMIEQMQWRAMAYGTTSQMGSERVQSSGSKQKMADAINRYIDIENEINQQIDKYVDKKKEIIEVIEELDLSEYAILHYIYIQGNTLEDYAEAEGKSYSWATTLHGRALKNVQGIIDENARGGNKGL